MSCKVRFYIFDEFIGGVDFVVCDYILKIIISNYFNDVFVLILIYLIFDIEFIFDEVIFFKEGEIDL